MFQFCKSVLLFKTTSPNFSFFQEMEKMGYKYACMCILLMSISAFISKVTLGIDAFLIFSIAY